MLTETRKNGEITPGKAENVECVYWTEPKATCRQCKNQPNAYNMYTDLEGILSGFLYLHVSFNSGVVHFCRYILAILALLCNTIRRNSIELL
jgi:hypothetical protein